MRGGRAVKPADTKAIHARFRAVVQRGLARADAERAEHLAGLKPGGARGLGVRGLSGDAGKQWRKNRRAGMPS